jgi:hypothetical protein
VFAIPNMALARLGQVTHGRKSKGLIAVISVALLLPAVAQADQKHVKPDHAALNALLDKFVPDVVRKENLKEGWNLVAGVEKTVSYAQWLRGNTSVQTYPAKGATFHGYVVNYSYPGDVGFDLLLQPTKKSLGAWSFRAEAKKIDGVWKIVTWYPVATFAPPGRTQTVLGPNDLGAGNASSASSGKARLGSWVLLVPGLAVALIAFGAIGFAMSRWMRQRSRVREIQRSLSR